VQDHVPLGRLIDQIVQAGSEDHVSPYAKASLQSTCPDGVGTPVLHLSLAGGTVVRRKLSVRLVAAHPLGHVFQVLEEAHW